MKNRITFAFILSLLSTSGFSQQWTGSSDLTDLISRIGNIRVNNLTLGKFNTSFQGDPDPFALYSRENLGTHDLVLFGNTGSSNLNLKLHDGDLKIGPNETPSAIIRNSGAATFASVTTKSGLNVGEDVSGLTNGYGSALKFYGASSNGDELSIRRFNNGPDKTELRVNIVNDSDGYDKFSVGTHHYSDGQWRNHFSINNQGAVGIGVNAEPYSGYRLSVGGKIRAEEVKVYTGWADFVFHDDYVLLPLADVEQFIKEKGHLPDVPSEAEVLENGIDVGAMNATLLQKIEELTLYMIEMKKENESLKDRISALEAKNR